MQFSSTVSELFGCLFEMFDSRNIIDLDRRQLSVRDEFWTETHDIVGLMPKKC